MASSRSLGTPSSPRSSPGGRSHEWRGQRDPGHRLAVLAREAGAGVPRPEPDPPRVARPRERSRLGSPAHLRCDAIELPVVIASGSVLRHATPGELADYLGLTVESLPDRCFDLVVVGGGPPASPLPSTGRRRACGRWESRVCVRRAGGHQLAHRELSRVPDGHLRRRPHRTRLRAGREVRRPPDEPVHGGLARRAVGASRGPPLRRHRSRRRAVIVATGARYRRLDATPEEFEGTASTTRPPNGGTPLAAAPVVVAGGGNSAGQASLFLAASSAR